jgi:hypothetical protein
MPNKPNNPVIPTPKNVIPASTHVILNKFQDLKPACTVIPAKAGILSQTRHPELVSGSRKIQAW